MQKHDSYDFNVSYNFRTKLTVLFAEEDTY